MIGERSDGNPASPQETITILMSLLEEKEERLRNSLSRESEVQAVNVSPPARPADVSLRSRKYCSS